jgi:hypothetical protein
MKYRPTLDQAELDLARGSVSSVRAEVFQKWKACEDGPERDFYRRRMDECDALLSKFDAQLISNRSQDAEPDQDEEEDQDQ